MFRSILSSYISSGSRLTEPSHIVIQRYPLEVQISPGPGPVSSD